jgi:hypothetical protein
MITKVVDKEVNYGRNGYLIFENNKVIFDTSDEEYGPITISIQLLKEKLKEHEKNMAH